MSLQAREKRHHCRVEYDALIDISWNKNGEFKSMQAKCKEMSVGGLRIETHESIAVGTLINLRLEHVDFSGSATVRYVSDEGSRFTLGLELSPETSMEILGPVKPN